MRSDPINPPAIVKEAESFADVMNRAKSMASVLASTERASLEKAVEIGHLLLKGKELCKHGEWLKALEKARISRSSASIYMQLSKCLALDISECGSIREAMALIKADAAEEEKVQLAFPVDDGCSMENGEPDEPVAPNSATEPADELAALDAPPAAPTPRKGKKRQCENCRWREESGKPTPENCRECAALNGGPPVTQPNAPPVQTRPIPTTTPRTPASANGREKFNLREFEADFGRVVRATDAFAKAYDALDTSDHADCSRLLNDYIKRFKAWHERLVK